MSINDLSQELIQRSQDEAMTEFMQDRITAAAGWNRHQDAANRISEAREFRIGDVWDIQYCKDMREQTGFRNKSGEHTVYRARNGQLYLSSNTPDGAMSHIDVNSHLIIGATLVSRTVQG